MRCATVIVSFLGCFVSACVDAPLGASPPVARLVASWDPLACGDPHRVVLELAAADTGAPPAVSVSATCALGGVTADVSELGTYRARVYAEDRPQLDAREQAFAIDRAVVDWPLGEPP